MEREQENRSYAPYTIAYMARAAFARGELERAAMLWGAVEDKVEHDRAPELVAMNDPVFHKARLGGRELDLWDAVAIALGEDDGQTVP